MSPTGCTSQAPTPRSADLYYLESATASVKDQDYAVLRRDRAANRQRNLEKAAGQAGIPEAYRAVSFQLDPRETPPSILQARDSILRWVERFAEARRAGHCLVIYGQPGTGKTRLACAIQLRVISEGYTAIYTKESMIHKRLLDADKAHQPVLPVIESYVAPELLVIDELGCQHGKPEARQERLKDIFDDRYTSDKPTVLVSNLTLPEIERHLGPMIWSRVSKKGFHSVAMYGPDYRRDHFT